MIWWALAGVFLAFSIAAWALWLAVVAILEVRTAKRTIAELIDLIGEEDRARTAILEAQTREVEAMRSHLSYLRHKIEDALRLYGQSAVIDGPLGSKRVQ